MFIGHYGVSLAAKRVDARLPLGWLFLAVQLPDILWAVLFLVGVEKAKIIPTHETAVRAVDLYYIPYSHSLLATLLWAGAIYALFRLLPSGEAGLRKSTVAIAMALAVFSHFVLDIIVESNLPLYDDAAKIGLGLSNYALAAYVVEGLILVAGLILYLRATTPKNLTGRYAMIVFVVLMLAFNLAMFGPPPTNLQFVAVSSLGSFAAMAGVLSGWIGIVRRRSHLDRHGHFQGSDDGAGDVTNKPGTDCNPIDKGGLRCCSRTRTLLICRAGGAVGANKYRESVNG